MRRGRDDHRVTLTDVARDHQPALRRPGLADPRARGRRGPGRGTPRRRGTAQNPWRPKASRHRDDGQQHGTGPPVRPGRRRVRRARAGLSDCNDPGDGYAARCATRPASPGDTGATQRRDDAEDRRGSNRWRRKQVRRDGDQADVARQQHDDRRADHLSRGRHRERVRKPAAAASGPATPPARRKHEQPAGREHGQREAVRPAKARVDEDQQDDRGAERGEPRPPTPARQSQRRRRHPSPSPAGRSARGGRARGSRGSRAARSPARLARAARSSGQRRALPRNIATLVPETATRCVSPDTLQSSLTSGGSRDVSPSTSPGTSPRSSAGSTEAARAVRRAAALRSVAGSMAGRRGSADRGPQRRRRGPGRPAPATPGVPSPQRAGWARDAPTPASARARGPERGSTMPCRAPRCVRAGH